ncbi:hypothetical protein PGB90_005998 [Kerria lacca]
MMERTISVYFIAKKKVVSKFVRRNYLKTNKCKNRCEEQNIGEKKKKKNATILKKISKVFTTESQNL